jgi:hypothetical protein
MDTGNPIEQIIATLKDLAQQGIVEQDKIEQVISILMGGNDDKVETEEEERADAERMFGTKFID